MPRDCCLSFLISPHPLFFFSTSPYGVHCGRRQTAPQPTLPNMTSFDRRAPLPYFFPPATQRDFLVISSPLSVSPNLISAWLLFLFPPSICLRWLHPPLLPPPPSGLILPRSIPNGLSFTCVFPIHHFGQSLPPPQGIFLLTFLSGVFTSLFRPSFALTTA